jgi:hypothetical protein
VRILTFVQYVVRFIKVWWAWERHEWDQMAKLLEGMVGSGLDANGERILLGVALTRQGRLSDGLHHFARVTRHELLASEEPVFFNEYAFALYRAGQVTDAADLLRSAPLDRFPAMQRHGPTNSSSRMAISSRPL